MTVVPAGPAPSVLVTDETVAAVVQVFVSGGSVRDMLEAAAGPIVAAWQHWEEDQVTEKRRQ